MVRAVYKYGFWLLLAVLLSACNATRYVPQGEYLLDKATVKCTDDKTVNTASLRNYLRQKQNTEIFGFWKMQLDVYNTAPKDTTTKSKKRLARNAHKMGEAPVVYDEDLTEVSMKQLKQQMSNMGYFHAEVDTHKVYKKRKIRLTYLVTANRPYLIRNYEVDIPVEAVALIAKDNNRCLVQPGKQFSTATLDAERERITRAIRNQGYFYFEKSMLEFTADSALNSHEVDVKIHLAEFVYHLDSVSLKRLQTQYYIREVQYTQDHKFLRKRALRRASRFHDGDRYAEWRLERTYSRISALPPVKYVDVNFVPVGDSLLDCHISVSRAKLNAVAVEAEGTYSGGDWGIGAGLTYTNRNIFHGAEVLTVGGRASYEWRQNGGRALEAKAEAGLLFPSNVRVNIAYNFQQRPDEYTRTIANAGLGYQIPRRPGSRWTHWFDLVNISYVFLPWISDRFREEFLSKSSVLKSSYEDHLILDWSYTGIYSTYDMRFPNRSYLQFSIRVETAGNFLYALSELAHFPTNKVGAYEIFKIPFAQYAKGDFNFTFHGVAHPKHHLLAHVGAGVAVPYLNATAVPFQKRYFAGGANGVRGWAARALGPGTFRGDGSKLVYDLQVGDIHLEANFEYRFKVLKFLELAAFTDAGNIWTIRNYESQPGGMISKDFYKQLGWSYGAGIRFDLSLFIFRVDFGVKIYDPSRIEQGKQWRTMDNGLNWKRDVTLHFAIGYPF